MSGVQEGKGIWFEGPRKVKIRPLTAPPPGPGEIRIRALVSLLSPGTEMLLYEGKVMTLAGVAPGQENGDEVFPVSPGYQTVGEVIDVGEGVPLPVGQRVFARNPHHSVFTMPYSPNYVAEIPDDIPTEKAAFANLAAVSVNGLIDGPVRVGDRAVVFGQGIVGTLTALLAARTADRLWVVDARADRRARATRIGFDDVLEPAAVKQAVQDGTDGVGADVCFDAAGSAAGLQMAIDVAGKEGTVVVLSFYGSKAVELRLSPEFHWGRLRIVSSNAAIVGSGMQPRWDRARRMKTALNFLRSVPTDKLITHRLPIESVSEGYEALRDLNQDALGVIVLYED